MSAMLSDSGVNTAIYAVIYLWFAWPVLLVLSLIGAWIAFALRRGPLAWWMMAAPMIWPVIALAVSASLLRAFPLTR
jgi:hypothetical protein